MKTLRSVEVIREVATSAETLERSRFRPEYFTRNRSMSFSDLLLFFLNPAKQCLQIRLNNFFKVIEKRGIRMSQQAVSKARSHFDHTPFEEMTRRLVQEEYGGEFPLETWNGYYVFGIDGSCAVLPNTPQLQNEFGVSGRSNNCASAGISILCDVLHDWIIDASINRYPQDERKSAKEHIKFLQEKMAHVEKKIILMDRGYPSADLLAHLQGENLYFLCRCQRSWLTQVDTAPMGDSVCEICKGQFIRVYKFLLPSGEMEILVTNLFDLPEAELPKLYFLRWGVEGKYDVLKNKIQLENFSGYTKNAILQDFWASITLTILVAIAKKEADEKLQARVGHKANRRKQMPNVSQLVGSLKDEFILICRYESDFFRDFAIARVIDEISRSVSTIRPDKLPHPRCNFPKKRQYPINRKSNV
jgi:hypothetical protein